MTHCKFDFVWGPFPQPRTYADADKGVMRGIFDVRCRNCGRHEVLTEAIEARTIAHWKGVDFRERLNKWAREKQVECRA